ncbi:hypothetical protein KY284_012206 [Solanum tuberosum]|nr:hypothetical protein KY284_012206 [Solanum tuberosum]
MGSTNLESNKLEMYEFGPFEEDEGFQIGFLIGQRFSKLIQNRTYYRARGLKILLLNFRKEILPFIPKTEEYPKEEDINDDCSDILVVSDSMAVAVHNEDANVALVGHIVGHPRDTVGMVWLSVETKLRCLDVHFQSRSAYLPAEAIYLVKVKLSNGTTFTAYTYAGELPSCAFGFNNHGVAFTLNSVPPCEEEIVGGAIGRNFVSRDLLEATSIEDALAVQDENSLSRQTRASSLAKESKSDFLALVGDMNNEKYPIYMTGPLLYTLCTAVIDLDEKILTIIEGNPKEKQESYVFSLS